MSRVNLDQDFCLVLADFRQNGQAFLETDPGEATFERTVTDIIEGQVEHVLAIIQFNPAEGRARDITEDVAQAVSERVCRDGDYPNEAVRMLLDAFGLGYPAPQEMAVWPRAVSPLPPQSSVTSLAEWMQDIPKKPAAASVTADRRSPPRKSESNSGDN